MILTTLGVLEHRDACTQTRLPGTIAVGNCSAGFELKSPSNVCGCEGKGTWPVEQHKHCA